MTTKSSAHAADQMSAGSRRVKIYVNAILGLCFLAVMSVLGLTALRPADDNLALIGIIIGLLTPVVAALMAAALKENHDATNSRLTDLLELTEKASRAEGRLARESGRP